METTKAFQVSDVLVDRIVAKLQGKVLSEPPSAIVMRVIGQIILTAAAMSAAYQIITTGKILF